jgi:hypothetical protein
MSFTIFCSGFSIIPLNLQSTMEVFRLKDESSLLLIAESVNEQDISDDDVVLPKKFSPENDDQQNTSEKDEALHRSKIKNIN